MFVPYYFLNLLRDYDFVSANGQISGKGQILTPQLRNRLIDFDEIRTLELSPEDHPSHKISF